MNRGCQDWCCCLHCYGVCLSLLGDSRSILSLHSCFPCLHSRCLAMCSLGLLKIELSGSGLEWSLLLPEWFTTPKYHTGRPRRTPPLAATEEINQRTEPSGDCRRVDWIKARRQQFMLPPRSMFYFFRLAFENRATSRAKESPRSRTHKVRDRARYPKASGRRQNPCSACPEWFQN